MPDERWLDKRIVLEREIHIFSASSDGESWVRKNVHRRLAGPACICAFAPHP